VEQLSVKKPTLVGGQASPLPTKLLQDGPNQSGAPARRLAQSGGTPTAPSETSALACTSTAPATTCPRYGNADAGHVETEQGRCHSPVQVVDGCWMSAKPLEIGATIIRRQLAAPGQWRRPEVELHRGLESLLAVLVQGI
jgi:hypothetical protein